MSLAVPPRDRVPASSRARAWSTSTRPRRRRRARPAIEAMDRYYDDYRASHPPRRLPARRRGDRRLRGRAREGRRVHGLDAPARPSSPATRPRRSTSSPTRGAAPTSARTTSWSITQMEHHSNIVPWQLRRRRAGLRAGRRRRPARPRRARRGCSPAGRSSSPSRTSPTCSARSTRSPRSLARAHAAGALVLVDGAQAVAAPAGRRRRARRRLLRLDRPQGLRADRHRRAARPPRAARGDAAVPRRRAHDRPRRRRRVHLGRAAREVRGGHDAGRRGDRPRRRASTGCRASAWTRCASTARDVVGYALERLSEVPGSHALRPVGPRAARLASISFALDGIHPHDVAEILGREGVCVRAGHHCAQPLMRRLGVAGHDARVVRRAHHARGRRPPDRRRSARCGRCSPDGRPVPREHPRALQAPASLGRARGLPTSSSTTLNPLCGDELKVQLKVDGDGKIADVALLRPRLRDLAGRRRR